MYKIIFLGKLNQTMEFLYKIMCREYQVQFCTEISDTMQNMIRIVEPDLLLINIADKSELTQQDVDMLTTYYLHIPVIFLTTNELLDEYAEFCRRDNVHCMLRPVTTTSVKSQCDVLLNKSGIVNSYETKKDEPKKNILVVDDGALTLRSVKALLDFKYNVSVATSGEMALKRMEKEIPDLVLLDYEMPGLNGKETLEIIRQNENTKDIPVIFLTGVADKHNIASVLELNPAGYILKPPDKEKLLESIEIALS